MALGLSSLSESGFGGGSSRTVDLGPVSNPNTPVPLPAQLRSVKAVSGGVQYQMAEQLPPGLTQAALSVTCSGVSVNVQPAAGHGWVVLTVTLPSS